MAIKKLIPLSLEEISSETFTHMVALTADDLTETTATTAQTITLASVPIGWIINKVMARLVTPFKDADVAGFNTTTLIVGDAGSSNRYITSAQLNQNGTEITVPQYNNTAYQTTAATPLLAVFGAPNAAYKLSDIDTGEVHLFFQLIDTKILSDLKGLATLLGT